MSVSSHVSTRASVHTYHSADARLINGNKAWLLMTLKTAGESLFSLPPWGLLYVLCWPPEPSEARDVGADIPTSGGLRTRPQVPSPVLPTSSIFFFFRNLHLVGKGDLEAGLKKTKLGLATRVGNVKVCAGARELRPVVRVRSLVLPAQVTTSREAPKWRSWLGHSSWRWCGGTWPVS